MIVGVTGTGAPFTRLVEALAQYARSPNAERVWVQHGSAVLPRELQGIPILPRAHLLERMRDASAVVCHAGCGTLGDAFSLGHVPIVMARRAHLGEHVNDHQLELLEALSGEGRILVADGAASISALVEEARRRRGPPLRPPTLKRLLAALRVELNQSHAPAASSRLDLVAQLTRGVVLRRL